MARSGGTMVGKCIGAMDGVRLFSEIHPAANHVPYMNVTDQAQRWYRLASEQDVAQASSFLDGLTRTYEACLAADKIMVLRDWASIDFIGKFLVNAPAMRFSLDEVVAAHFSIRSVALVRHPLDQWLSTRRLKIYRNKLDLSEFFYGYRCYAEAVKAEFVRYEDFTRRPEESMKQICSALGLKMDRKFLKRWHLNHCITGDNKKTSRGSAGDDGAVIRSLPRREVEDDLLAAAASNPDYRASIDLLGY